MKRFPTLFSGPSSLVWNCDGSVNKALTETIDFYEDWYVDNGRIFVKGEDGRTANAGYDFYGLGLYNEAATAYANTWGTQTITGTAKLLNGPNGQHIITVYEMRNLTLPTTKVMPKEWVSDDGGLHRSLEFAWNYCPKHGPVFTSLVGTEPDVNLYATETSAATQPSPTTKP